MIKLLLIIAGVVVALVGLALVVVPAAGGPEPVMSKPTEAECEQWRAGDARSPESVDVAWVWGATSYGWGCKYRYADGSTGTAIIRSRPSTPAGEGR